MTNNIKPCPFCGSPLEDELRKALTDIVELCETGGFISTDAKFKIIAHTARKALDNNNKE